MKTLSIQSTTHPDFRFQSYSSWMKYLRNYAKNGKRTKGNTEMVSKGTH